jgi:Fe-S-cluster-containing hydrogenase component 2
MVCSFYHTGRFSPSLSRVTVVKDDRYGLDYPVMCHQCEECPPMEICPTGAIKSSETGVIVDHEVCISCGVCVDACKYDAVKVSKQALICNQCNGEPRCVDRCPTGALGFDEAPESIETPETAFIRLKEIWSLG